MLLAVAMDQLDTAVILNRIAQLIADGVCKEGMIEWGQGVDIDDSNSTKTFMIKAIYKIEGQGVPEMIGNPEL